MENVFACSPLKPENLRFWTMLVLYLGQYKYSTCSRLKTKIFWLTLARAAWKSLSPDRRRGSDVRAHQIVPRVRRWPSRSAVDTQPSRQYAFVRLWSVVVRQIRRFHGIGRHLHRQWAEDAAAFDHQARGNRIHGHAGHSFKDASLPNFVSRVEHDGYQTLFG